LGRISFRPADAVDRANQEIRLPHRFVRVFGVKPTPQKNDDSEARAGDAPITTPVPPPAGMASRRSETGG